MLSDKPNKLIDHMHEYPSHLSVRAATSTRGHVSTSSWASLPVKEASKCIKNDD